MYVKHRILEKSLLVINHLNIGISLSVAYLILCKQWRGEGGYCNYG